MDYIGTDFNSTGSVIPKSELTAARLKRGECPTCGRKCFKKKLFKMIPIDDEKVLKGRCLHCNPLDKNPSSHSYNRSSSVRSHSGRQLQRSTTYHPSTTHRDVSAPPARAMSSPPHAKDASRKDSSHDRSTRTTSAMVSLSDNSFRSVRSDNDDDKPRAFDHSAHTTQSFRSSFHSSSAVSLDSASSHSDRHQPSPEMSQEELKRAARILLSAAQEHGLGGALATSLQDLVHIAESGTPGKERNGGTPESGILDRGGALRSGRLIYAGSCRTLSSMSSIDEGDRNDPSTYNQVQQALRTVGKSSRTLGSLSTIDGTNEDETIFQNDKESKSRASTTKSCSKMILEPPSDSDPSFSLSNFAETEESFVSNSMSEGSTLTQKKSHDVCREKTKCYDTEIDSIVQQLRDSMDSSSPAPAMEAMKSLSEFLSLFLDDPESSLDIYLEKGLAGVLVAVMRKYAGSSEIQIKTCEVLANLVTPNDNNRRSSSSRRSQIIVEQEGAGEAIVFSSMILHEDNPKVQEAALNTMRYLCKDCQETQTKFWELDSIQPILRSMERHPKLPRVQEIGATLVSMLANNPNNENAKTVIGENSGVSIILQSLLMHLEDSAVVEACFRALYTLVQECPYNIHILLKSSGATIAILDAMRCHAQILAVQEIGCAILVEVTKLAEHTDLLLENGGSTGTGMPKQDHGEDSNELLERLIETVLETIQNHSSVAIVQDFGFAVLANLTDSNETKMFIVDLGTLDAIVLAMVLHKENVGVQERICSLLLLLAVEQNHQHILAANPIELVKVAAHKYPEECLESASRLIEQLGLEPL